jgi:hypothetical protein
LPEAYEGKNQQISQTIDELIYTDETFYTSVLLPFNFTEQMGVTWDKWEFNEHFTGIVPEQGVSRLVSSHRETRSESFIRRGLAAMFEHGFMVSLEQICLGILTGMGCAEHAAGTRQLFPHVGPDCARRPGDDQLWRDLRLSDVPQLQQAVGKRGSASCFSETNYARAYRRRSMDTFASRRCASCSSARTSCGPLL